MNATPGLKFSVIIGRVSSEDGHQILNSLQALREQHNGHDYEAIVADRRNDEISQEIRKRYPEVKLIACPRGTSLPQLLTTALREASGEYLLVTEDHCVPTGDWFTKIEETFGRAPDNAAAVGGCIENGIQHNGFQWATFLCEYSAFLSPVTEGQAQTLPGFNIAYRRSVLADIDPQQLTSGFWETTVHPLLLRRGLVFWSSNDIRLQHCKDFSFHLFVAQRWAYSRYYADRRFSRSQWVLRGLAACACVLLPFLLMWRIGQTVLGKGRLYKELARATPYLLFFVLVWALGESWGYLFGATGALSAIE